MYIFSVGKPIDIYIQLHDRLLFWYFTDRPIDP
jgi:hypothetical protein